MRIATVLIGGHERLAMVKGESLVVLADDEATPRSILNLIGRGEAGLAQVSAAAAKRAEIALADIHLLAPIPVPRRNVFCVGKNYGAHAAEFHGSGFDTSSMSAVPQHPVFFSKATTSVIGTTAPIEADVDPTGTTDYEGEIAVVIGRGGRGISAADALDHVFGYTNLNDVTSRELQRTHGQWFLGKSLDTFCPMGPWITTADELPDPTRISFSVDVNGETRQSASLSDLIFSIPVLIETLSHHVTLLPGDIIATGTPAGVGIGFSPPRYLQDGDVVTVHGVELGALTNPVVRRAPTSPHA